MGRPRRSGESCRRITPAAQAHCIGFPKRLDLQSRRNVGMVTEEAPGIAAILTRLLNGGTLQQGPNRLNEDVTEMSMVLREPLTRLPLNDLGVPNNERRSKTNHRPHRSARAR